MFYPHIVILFYSELSYGSSVKVEGDLVPSPAKGQRLELQATDIQVHGFCDGQVPVYQAQFTIAIART